MRNLICLSIIISLIAFYTVQKSYADCIAMPNGSGNDINCPLPLQSTTLGSPDTTNGDDVVTIPNPGGIDALVGNGISTLMGNDIVNVNGIVRSDVNAIATAQDNDMIFVGPGADIFGGNGGLDMGGGGDFMQITGGMLSSGGSTINSAFGDDTIEILGGSLSVNGAPMSLIFMTLGNDTLRILGGSIGPGSIETGDDEDLIIISGGIFAGNEIDAGLDVDTIHITDDIPNLGILNCGGGAGMDSLILSMDVPEGQVAALSAEFLAGGEFNDITVNGITYEWAECENRVPNFNGVVTTISLAPHTATNIIGDSHTVTATVLTDGQPDPGVEVVFEIISGPNGPLNDLTTTDANGEATFTYVGDAIGTDRIVAIIQVQGLGPVRSNTVSKTWILPPRNVPTLSEWGLITMAGIMGFLGFMILRRRQQSA